MNVISCKVVFLKSKIPSGWVRPIWIMIPPGFIHFIACCLVISNPTVSKTISKWLLLIFLLSGWEPLAFKYLRATPSLLSFGSTIVISLQCLTFDKISAQSNPIAPAPITKALLFFNGLTSSFSPSWTACRATAQGSAIGASLRLRFFGIHIYFFLVLKHIQQNLLVFLLVCSFLI